MRNETKKVEISIFQKAKTGNHCSGDSYFYQETDTGFICALADGLGTGKFANESAEIVIDVVKENSDDRVEWLMKKANDRLIGKRGAVLGFLQLDFEQRTYSFSSVGNIVVLCMTASGERKRSIPNAGYLSGASQRVKVTRGTLEPNKKFIMFTDGVKDKELMKLKEFSNHGDVESIIKAFECISERERADDTTLIAMQYAGD